MGSGGGGESPLAIFFEDSDFERNYELGSDDIFSILEAFECVPEFNTFGETGSRNSSTAVSETEVEASPRCKRQKVVVVVEEEDGQGRVSHITVERNRRKQMNEHLSVLRSLMPCFYVKRVSVLHSLLLLLQLLFWISLF